LVANALRACELGVAAWHGGYPARAGRAGSGAGRGWGIGGLPTFVADDHCDDEAVDANNASHDDGDDALHHELGLLDAHHLNPHAALCRTVCGTHVCVETRSGCERASGTTGSREGLGRFAAGGALGRAGVRRRALAKMSAKAAPMNPKKGAIGEHLS